MALYAGHHVGDYWVQTHHQAIHKAREGGEGRWACLKHVATYAATQAAFLGITATTTGERIRPGRLALALAVSAATHYAADRGEHGLMFRAARALPGKENFLKLGVPRSSADNPVLGTGAWALDQAWHVALGVFVPALILAGRKP
jgi:hypothetical protein